MNQREKVFSVSVRFGGAVVYYVQGETFALFGSRDFM